MTNDIEREPFEGIGKPEPLKHNLSEFWSHRITDMHRLVYAMEDDQILIPQARYRYSSGIGATVIIRLEPDHERCSRRPPAPPRRTELQERNPAAMLE